MLCEGCAQSTGLAKDKQAYRSLALSSLTQVKPDRDGQDKCIGECARPNDMQCTLPEHVTNSQHRCFIEPQCISQTYTGAHNCILYIVRHCKKVLSNKARRPWNQRKTHQQRQIVIMHTQQLEQADHAACAYAVRIAHKSKAHNSTLTRNEYSAGPHPQQT